MSRVVILVAGCAILWSLESVLPLYRFEDGRLRRAIPNIGLTALLLLTNLALSIVVATAANLGGARLTNVLAGVIVLDFFAWIAHVLLHKLPFAWRFHCVHHSEREVDVTTAFRQHPGESVWRVFWQLPAIVLFGIPLWIVVVYVTVSAANAQLEHANIRLREPFDRLLRLVFVTPNMHKVHHSTRQRETDSNYANIFSIWDRVFGTYTSEVDFAALRYGLDDVEAGALRELLVLPWKRVRAS